MIVATPVCVGCRRPFGLTRRQCHPGLVAQRTRCGPCRLARRRELGRARARAFRLRCRNAESAVVHAPARREALSEAGGR